LRAAWFGGISRVDHQQLHLLLNLAELHPLRATHLRPAALHQAAKHARLADARCQLGREEQGFTKGIGLELDPDFVLLLPDR
jgi:hypothetical protein